MAVAHRDGSFWVTSDLADVEFQVTSDLAVDKSSEGYTFEVLPLVRRDLRENQIFDIWVHDGAKRRVGWFVPANAMSSDAHDFAENEHFLKYVYPAMHEVLKSHQEIFRNALEDAILRGVSSASFADLFDTNLGFLVVCRELLDVSGTFDTDRLIPSLVSYGWVPLEYCAPAAIEWTCSEFPSDNGSIVLNPVSGQVSSPDLAAMLFCVAASANTSPVTQFFYLYQVVELLMEEVLHGLLPEIGNAVAASIELKDYATVRDQLDGLNSTLSEKSRLRVLMKSIEGGDKAIQELASASDAFLSSVGMSHKAGIDGLYQVRNFIVHQVRNMRPEVAEQLDIVTRELAIFLAFVLGAYRRV